MPADQNSTTPGPSAFPFSTPIAKSTLAVLQAWLREPQRGDGEVRRYTHRVAICNHRLQHFDSDAVTFQWKDYKHGAASRTMTLAADEFIRRFLLHVLPDGFKHIRSYGLLANRHRAAKLATCRQPLGVVAPAEDTSSVMDGYRDRYQRLTGRSLRDCPVCARAHMVCIETFLPGAHPRAPPRGRHVH